VTWPVASICKFQSYNDIADAMKSYHISESLGSQSRTRGAAISTTVGMVLFACVEIWRGRFNVVDWLGFALMYWLFSYFFPIETPNYDLEIDGDGIRVVREGVVRRVLQKDRIRYVREWNVGKRLVISEHGPVWTRLLCGRISVPQSVPGYEEIKAQALSLLSGAATTTQNSAGSNP
jgi:hypothetical protein